MFTCNRESRVHTIIRCIYMYQIKVTFDYCSYFMLHYLIQFQYLPSTSSPLSLTPPHLPLLYSFLPLPLLCHHLLFPLTLLLPPPYLFFPLPLLLPLPLISPHFTPPSPHLFFPLLYSSLPLTSSFPSLYFSPFNSYFPSSYCAGENK